MSYLNDLRQIRAAARAEAKRPPQKLGFARRLFYILGTLLFGSIGLVLLFGAAKEFKDYTTAKKVSVTVSYKLPSECPRGAKGGGGGGATYSLTGVDDNRAYKLNCASSSLEPGQKIIIYVIPSTGSAYEDKLDIITTNLTYLVIGFLCVALAFWFGYSLKKGHTI